MKLCPLNPAKGTIKRLLFIDNVPLETSQASSVVILPRPNTNQRSIKEEIFLRHQKIIEVMRRECPGIEFWYIRPCNFDVDFLTSRALLHALTQGLDVGNFNFGADLNGISSDFGGDSDGISSDFGGDSDMNLVLNHSDIKCILIDMDFGFLAKQLAQRGLFGRFPILLPNFPDPSLPLDWIQDAFFVQTDDQGKEIVLLDSYYFWVQFPLPEDGVDDSRALAEVVSSYLPRVISGCPANQTLTRSTKYIFQGGNVIAGDSFVFVGLDVVRRNFIAYFEEESAKPEWRNSFAFFMQDLAATFSASLIVCPGLDMNMDTFSPKRQVGGLKHLDQFLTFAGFENVHEDSYLVMLGTLFDWIEESSIWEPVETAGSEIQEELEAVRRWLESPEEFGFEFPFSFTVKRIPIMRNGEEIWYSPNCHLQNKNGKLEAFIPQFAIEDNRDSLIHKEADALIERMYCDAGFSRTIRIPQKYLINASSERAGLHCLTVVLSRGEP
jgi:hypothetical protein